MKLRTLLIFGIGVMGGIYLTTKEGEKAQKKIKEYSVSLVPIVKDLLKKADYLLDDLINLKSDELKVNLERKVNKLKEKVSSIKDNDLSSIAKNTIKESTNMLRKIRAEINLSPKMSNKRMKYEKKTVSELRKIAKTRKIQLQPVDKKSNIIDKLIKQDK